MLILQKDEIEVLVEMKPLFPKLEKAFQDYSEGRVNMPPVGHIVFPDFEADCHIKYGYVEGDDFFAIKVATGFPLNTREGIATGNGMVLVLSAETGAVKAMLHDEAFLTDFRTGISGAIASRLLAKKDAKKVLVVGTGLQAGMQIEAHAVGFDQALEFKVWGRSEDKARSLVEAIKDKHVISYAEDLEAACRDADIIITATGTTEPIVKADWVGEGTHITAVGADAPGKQELETALSAKADIIAVDSKTQCIDHGEIEEAVKQDLIDESDILEIGTILSSPELGRTSNTQITLADTTGIAVHDIAMAGEVLERSECGG